jgi:hypothetical protein
MLSGNLELFPLADVLRFVARSGATGAVNIYRSTDGGRVLLVDGHVVGASVDGYDPSDADGVVDTGVRLFDAPGGEFALELEPADGPARFAVEEFLTAVARRRAEWRKIIGAVGGLDEPLQLEPHLPPGTTEITLTPVEWQIAIISDGTRSLREIAQEIGQPEFATATALLAMANAGLLAVTGAPGLDAIEEDADDAEPYSDESAETSHEPGQAGSSGDESDEGDIDPADLLRELGGQRPPQSRRRGAATREEQRLRLRSR